jgi:sec-independent protein translocase protein TatB
MFGIGTTELLVIMVVALIVVGPKKLPQIARSLGKVFGEFRRVSTDLHRTINVEIEREEREQKEKEEKKKEETKGLESQQTDSPPEKTPEDLQAEKTYQSAVAANTLPEKPTETARDTAEQPEAADTHQAEVEVLHPDAAPRSTATSQDTASTPSTDKKQGASDSGGNGEKA